MIDLEVSPFINLHGIKRSGCSVPLESTATSLPEQKGNELVTIFVNGLICKGYLLVQDIIAMTVRC